MTGQSIPERPDPETAAPRPAGESLSARPDPAEQGPDQPKPDLPETDLPISDQPKPDLPAPDLDRADLAAPPRPAIVISREGIALAQDETLFEQSISPLPPLAEQMSAADQGIAETPAVAPNRRARPEPIAAMPDVNAVRPDANTVAPDPIAAQIRPPAAAKRYFPPPPQIHTTAAARPKLFAATPPLVFQAVLGLVMALAAIKALRPLSGPHDALIGISAGLWLFCMSAYATKLLRRAACLREDLRVLTGNAGLAAAALSTAALAVLVQPIWPGLALVMAALGLSGQLIMAVMAGQGYLRQGPRDVTPVWQLNFASFSLGGIVMAGAGQILIAQISLALSLLGMVVVGALSLRQLLARIPPAALRPLLVLHLLPPALLAVLAAKLGYGMMSLGLLAASLLLAVTLFASLRWILTAGFTPIWAVIPAPIGAFAWALQAQVIFIGAWVVAALALIAAIWIGYKILKLWAENKLAPQTNSATA